jgi:hypothetical protein
MLPSAYGLPAAVLLILGGALACFAGYRLFRLVLGIYGFILGAMIASSVVGGASTAGMVVAAIVGGLVGALVLVMAYFVGIALVGAGLGALLGSAIWSWVSPGDPPVLVIIVVSIAGAIGAMLLQRYVIIVGTAFGGAWTLMVGVSNLLAIQGITGPAATGQVWILYPATVPGETWAPLAWVALGLVGLAVQLAITSRKK